MVIKNTSDYSAINISLFNLHVQANLLIHVFIVVCRALSIINTYPHYALINYMYIIKTRSVVGSDTARARQLKTFSGTSESHSKLPTITFVYAYIYIYVYIFVYIYTR